MKIAERNVCSRKGGVTAAVSKFRRKTKRWNKTFGNQIL